MISNEFTPLLVRAARINGVGSLIDTEKLEQLFCLFCRLVEENSKYNLTAITDPVGVVYKHFIDSLLVADHFPVGSTAIDIGCGAGFPSLPLAIVRPDLKLHPLDSTSKKVRFIELISSELGLNNVTAHVGRAEELAHNPEFRDKFDYSVARAVANFPVLAELCTPFLRPDGIFLAMKGRFSSEELSLSGKSLAKLSSNNLEISTYSLNLDGAFESRTLVSLKKCGLTPKNFPRKYSQISKDPLK